MSLTVNLKFTFQFDHSSMSLLPSVRVHLRFPMSCFRTVKCTEEREKGKVHACKEDGYNVTGTSTAPGIVGLTVVKVKFRRRWGDCVSSTHDAFNEKTSSEEEARVLRPSSGPHCFYTHTHTRARARIYIYIYIIKRFRRRRRCVKNREGASGRGGGGGGAIIPRPRKARLF